MRNCFAVPMFFLPLPLRNIPWSESVQFFQRVQKKKCKFQLGLGWGRGVYIATSDWLTFHLEAAEETQNWVALQLNSPVVGVNCNNFAGVLNICAQPPTRPPISLFFFLFFSFSVSPFKLGNETVWTRTSKCLHVLWAAWGISPSRSSRSAPQAWTDLTCLHSVQNYFSIGGKKCNGTRLCQCFFFSLSLCLLKANLLRWTMQHKSLFDSVTHQLPPPVGFSSLDHRSSVGILEELFLHDGKGL